MKLTPEWLDDPNKKFFRTIDKIEEDYRVGRIGIDERDAAKQEAEKYKKAAIAERVKNRMES